MKWQLQILKHRGRAHMDGPCMAGASKVLTLIAIFVSVVRGGAIVVVLSAVSSA